MIGADGIFVVRAAGDAFVLDAVNLLVVERRGEIDPVVGDDARVHRPHTGEDGGMTDAGDGRGMALIARGNDRAVEQARETAGEARSEAHTSEIQPLMRN